MHPCEISPSRPLYPLLLHPSGDSALRPTYPSPLASHLLPSPGHPTPPSAPHPSAQGDLPPAPVPAFVPPGPVTALIPYALPCAPRLMSWEEGFAAERDQLMAGWEAEGGSEGGGEGGGELQPLGALPGPHPALHPSSPGMVPPGPGPHGSHGLRGQGKQQSGLEGAVGGSGGADASQLGGTLTYCGPARLAGLNTLAGVAGTQQYGCRFPDFGELLSPETGGAVGGDAFGPLLLNPRDLMPQRGDLTAEGMQARLQVRGGGQGRGEGRGDKRGR